MIPTSLHTLASKLVNIFRHQNARIISGVIASHRLRVRPLTSQDGCPDHSGVAVRWKEYYAAPFFFPHHMGGGGTALPISAVRNASLLTTPIVAAVDVINAT